MKVFITLKSAKMWLPVLIVILERDSPPFEETANIDASFK